MTNIEDMHPAEAAGWMHRISLAISTEVGLPVLVIVQGKEGPIMGGKVHGEDVPGVLRAAADAIEAKHTADQN